MSWLVNPIEGEWEEITPKEYKNEFYTANKPQDILTATDCVFARMRDWFLSFFDDDYFKTIRTKSEMPSFSEFHTFMKRIPEIKEKPLIVFNNENLELVEETATDMSLTNTRMEPDGARIATGNIPCMDFSTIVEQNQVLGMTFKTTRYKMDIDVLMVTQGRQAHWSLFNFLINNMRFRSKFTIRRDILCRIDVAFIQNIAKILNLDSRSPEFITEINKHSIYPVKRIMPNNNISKEAFYFNIPLDIYVDIPSSPNADNPSKKGMIESALRLTTNFTVEVDYPSEFYFLVSEELIPDPVVGLVNPEHINYIPPIRENIHIQRFITLNGESFINIDAIDTVIDDESLNFVTVDDLFIGFDIYNSRIKPIIDKDPSELNNYVFISVYEDGKVYSDFEVKDRTLFINNPSKTKLYTILIYINNERMNIEINEKSILTIGDTKFQR
jgi:hypothetical protein